MKPKIVDKSPYEAIVRAVREITQVPWTRRWLPKEFTVKLGEDSFKHLLANSVNGDTKQPFAEDTTAVAITVGDYRVIVQGPRYKVLDSLASTIENVLDKDKGKH